ncbi:MAG: H(+)-transporting ATPase [Labilithrix sp.]|nr:H(+)-transporting ATPase [Labilithrix sp.]
MSTTLNAGLLSSGLSEGGGGVNVDLDASLLVQIVLFVVLLVFLKPLLFEPMLKLFEEREKRIEGTRREASKEDERSAKALAKYEAVLAKAREAGAAERDALRAEGAKTEAEIMARVRSLAATTIEQGRAALASEAKRTRAELTSEASVLGRAIASQVLGREVSR